MLRANPEDRRQALEIACALARAGVLFIPYIPEDIEEYKKVAKENAEKLNSFLEEKP